MTALHDALGQDRMRLLSCGSPGRVRVAVPGIYRCPSRAVEVEEKLSRMDAVHGIEVNALTGNVLVRFDASLRSGDDVVRGIAAALDLEEVETRAPENALGSELLVRSAIPSRLRIEVAGLHRHPENEARIAAALESIPGIRSVSGSALTGTVLVRHDADASDVPPLLEAVRRALATIPVDPAGVPSSLPEAVTTAPNAKTNAPAAVPSQGTPPWHAQSVAEVELQLGVDGSCGLSTEEVLSRRASWGANRLSQPTEEPLGTLFLRQFCNAPSALLGAGTVLSLVTGGLFDAALIAGVLILNASIGAGTERTGARSINALRRGAPLHARVRRGGEESMIAGTELVPGDVILLRAGDPIPADARLVRTERLRVEESALTGESSAVEKRARRCAEETTLADRTDMVHRGTTVVGGRATAIVVETGDQTAYGRLRFLAVSAETPPTPLERDLDTLGRNIAIGATGVCAVVFGLSLLRGVTLIPALSTAVGLGVAAIPEALPTIATTVLAFGSGRMRRKGTLIRTLSAAEALGSVTHVCADKTGTLTENRMAARELSFDGQVVAIGGLALSPGGAFEVDGRAIVPRESATLIEALEIGALCSDAEVRGIADGELLCDGSPTEGALVIAAVKAGIDVARLRLQCPILDRRDRGDYRRHMLTVHQRDGRTVALVKGSPEDVLTLCDRVIREEATVALTRSRRADVERRNGLMAERAMRVLALAQRELPPDYADEDLRSGFKLCGLIGLVDPIRPQVPDAIQALHRAGIRTIMITGDQAPTAVAVARELGLSRSGSLTTVEADELRTADPQRLREIVREVGIFARVPPELKLAVVRALQANGNIVAMTGDGVNDAPALRAADVGVAMGERGTELSRELADVVLSTDDFGKMVDAVEEGRLVRANVRRVVHYLLATNAAEVWVVLGAVALGMPSPLSPLQLLWLNLVTDLAPALALAVEPRDPSLMQQPPRDPGESIVPPSMLRRIVGESAVIALAALGVYAVGVSRYGFGPAAQTMAFASLVGAQLLHAPLARTGSRPASLGGSAPNRWLVAGLGVSAALQLAALFVPGLRTVLGGAALGLTDLAVAALGALAAILAIEGHRLLRHNAPRGLLGAAAVAPS